MKNEIRELCDYKEKLTGKKQTSEYFLDKALMMSEKLNEKEHEGLGKIVDGVRGVRFFANGLGAFIADEVEKQVRRNKVAKILGCDKKEVAVDMFSLNKDTKYLANDITYKANIDKENLRNLKLVFGDAHFEALEDYSYLSSLDMVYGDLYLRGERTLDDIPTKVATYGKVYNSSTLRRR